jgi:hypothetical protein
VGCSTGRPSRAIRDAAVFPEASTYPAATCSQPMAPCSPMMRYVPRMPSRESATRLRRCCCIAAAGSRHPPTPSPSRNWESTGCASTTAHSRSGQPTHPWHKRSADPGP